MKKIKLEGKLNLNKETVTRLNEAELKRVNGGTFMTLKGCNNGTKFCVTDTCQTVNFTCTIVLTQNCPTLICPTQDATACNSKCGDVYCP
ncbi:MULTISPECIES: class I lanthipeptide [Flavobacterium]|uniref:Class I lanthipeptide n=1 Tax=Flavobacterium jumunjinense TaxID=998845 RepID=A0ABV5GM07_9FLAO|nr:MULTISPECIES: class I lanthipeptide [Flavobacterium]